MTNAQSNSPFAIFRNRNFTFMWTGQLVSSIGSALTTLAASVLVFRETGSALSVGLMLIATSGPTIVIGMLAGVFVDRYDRKRIMLVSDLLRAILIFLIPSLIHLHLNWLYVIVALTSGITQFFDSAHASVLPEVASDEELASANALMSISSVGSQMIGFAAAGFIVAKLPVEWAFYIDAVSFVLSAFLILFTVIPFLPPIESTSVRAIAENLKSGLGVVTNTPILRSLFIIAGPIFLLIGFQNTLLLPFALNELNGTEFDFGLQQASEAIGIAIGSLFMARLADRIREGQWLVISYVLMAIFSIWYSFAHSMALGIFLTGVIGLVNTPSYIGRQLVIQRATPREARGRVNSAFFVVRDVTFVLGMALAGLADLYDIRTMMLYSSYLFLAVGLTVLFLPGLGQPAAEWKRAITLLRTAPNQMGLGQGNLLTPADRERLAQTIPAFSRLDPEKLQRLTSQMTLHEVAAGTVIIRRSETSDSAYFILSGHAFAGWDDNGNTKVLEILQTGDFFGEIAALTGAIRTANVITDQASTLVRVPSQTLREMSTDPQLNRIFMTRMTERMVRMNMIDTSRLGHLDQQVLHDLRTSETNLD